MGKRRSLGRTRTASRAASASRPTTWSSSTSSTTSSAASHSIALTTPLFSTKRGSSTSITPTSYRCLLLSSSSPATGWWSWGLHAHMPSCRPSEERRHLLQHEEEEGGRASLDLADEGAFAASGQPKLAHKVFDGIEMQEALADVCFRAALFMSKHALQARQDRAFGHWRRERKRATEAFKFWLSLPNSGATASPSTYLSGEGHTHAPANCNILDDKHTHDLDKSSRLAASRPQSAPTPTTSSVSGAAACATRRIPTSFPSSGPADRGGEGMVAPGDGEEKKPGKNKHGFPRGFRFVPDDLKLLDISSTTSSAASRSTVRTTSYRHRPPPPPPPQGIDIPGGNELDPLLYGYEESPGVQRQTEMMRQSRLCSRMTTAMPAVQVTSAARPPGLRID